MSDAPLDVLEAALGDPVAVRLKDGQRYGGTLGAYDQHMNLVLEPAAALVDGAGGAADVGESETGDEPADPADAEAVAGTASERTDDPESTDGGGSRAVRWVDNTTVIRGDNVVTIIP